MLMVIVLALSSGALSQGARVHSVCDISHEFTFYMDGRFWAQYIGEAGGADARNWGTLHKLNLDDANLLVLSSGATPIEYDPRSIEHVRAFAETGGAAVVLADCVGYAPEQPFHIQRLAQAFGATFTGEKAEEPLSADPSLGAEKLEFYGGGTLALEGEWTVLIRDAREQPVLARRPVGNGFVLVGIRGLFGHQPDAKDPINAQWVKPLLQDLVRNKPVDPARPPQGQWAELTKAIGPLTLEYTEGTEYIADAIAAEYFIVKDELMTVTGVPPSPGTLTALLMLPTGGGGFSSGARIGIGAWWGGFPENRYPMIELIGHEAGHSWVLPYPEPVWNEPIATYLGIQVGKRLGMPEAQQTLERTIARAREHDPEMDKLDLLAPDAPNAVVWGKSFWLFEQLEATHGPGAMAKYFQAKRRLLQPGRERYSLDDCVAVWSNAVGEDLFPWFRGLGITVDPARTDVALPAKP